MTEAGPGLRLHLPSASRQVAFHQLLLGARQTWLKDALQDALATAPPDLVREQLGNLVPNDVSRILAAAGIRDEYVFPVPALLEAKPTLLGYYRLLMGVSQKIFYRGDSGAGAFKSMEVSGVIGRGRSASLPALCLALSEPLAELIRQMPPTVTLRDVDELQLLTLGSQFQGGNNNSIGAKATLEVFLAIGEIVAEHISARTERRITLRNAAQRDVVIALAADPDVRIQEDFNGAPRNKVAIEIKGGTDVK